MSLKPNAKPANPYFSSGPCTKRPGWTSDVVARALLGRSHRSTEGRERLAAAIDKTKSVLGLPDGFEVAIVPGSDTGAFELAMWNLLGERGVDVFAWESFGQIWVTDALKELKIADARAMTAPFGQLPDLSAADFSRDVIFTANGTSAGVKIPGYDWIPADRAGLTLVDATSAIFAQPIDWSKADVVTYSWQKVLGGEAAHGMLILSPRAIARLESAPAPRALPKLFRIMKGGKLDRAIFKGDTINTPSMMCVEDYIDALDWAASIGGLAALQARADRNAAVLYDWIDRSTWARPLCAERALRSNTAVCISFAPEAVAGLSGEATAALAKRMVTLLEAEGAALDAGAYRDAPPGLRLWTGATVETADLEAVRPWLDWAFATARAEAG